jgi:hypothetical protein
VCDDSEVATSEDEWNLVMARMRVEVRVNNENTSLT